MSRNISYYKRFLQTQGFNKKIRVQVKRNITGVINDLNNDSGDIEQKESKQPILLHQSLYRFLIFLVAPRIVSRVFTSDDLEKEAYD